MNESNDDGRATLTWNTPTEMWRNWAPAGFDRRHNFTVGFAYQLPWQSGGTYDNVLKSIVNDWQLNGVFAAFSGTPFTVTASGTSLNTPSNTQTADLTGSYNTTGLVGNAGTYFDTTAVRAADWCSLRDFRARPVLRSWWLHARLLHLPDVPGGRTAAARVPAGSRKRPEPCRQRQPGWELYLRHVRTDHWHQRQLPGTAGQTRPPVPVLERTPECELRRHVAAELISSEQATR